MMESISLGGRLGRLAAEPSHSPAARKANQVGSSVQERCGNAVSNG